MGGILSFFAGPLGKVVMVAALIGGFFWWLKVHDASRAIKIKADTRVEMARELDEVKKEEWKQRETELADREKVSIQKSEVIDRTLAQLNQATEKIHNEAIRLKATNAARLAAIPAAVKAIPDPQLEIEYRAALVELRMQEAQP